MKNERARDISAKRHDRRADDIVRNRLLGGIACSEDSSARLTEEPSLPPCNRQLNLETILPPLLFLVVCSSSGSATGGYTLDNRDATSRIHTGRKNLKRFQQRRRELFAPWWRNPKAVAWWFVVAFLFFLVGGILRAHNVFILFYFFILLRIFPVSNWRRWQNRCASRFPIQVISGFRRVQLKYNHTKCFECHIEADTAVH